MATPATIVKLNLASGAQIRHTRGWMCVLWAWKRGVNLQEQSPTADTEDMRDELAPSEHDLLRCAPGLKAVLLRLTHNLDTAAELLQEVMISGLRALRAGRIRDQQSLPAYMHEAAKNAALSHARRAPLSLTGDALEGNFWSATNPTPLDHYEQMELSAIAAQVLDELPNERDRLIIRAFYLEGRSKTELMTSLSIGADVFDKVMSRARMRMRERLQEKLGSAAKSDGKEPSRLQDTTTQTGKGERI